MKKVLLGLLFISGIIYADAQYRGDFGFRIGASNYLGDIGGKEQTRRDFIWDMKLRKTRWTVGGFYRHRFNKNFGVTGSLTYARVEGDDAFTTNRARRGRNLNFVNDMLEFSGRGEYYFYSHDDVTGRGKYFLSMRSFVFAGVGGLVHAPKTRDASNDRVFLRREETEGNRYGLLTATIPVGVGVYFTYKKEHRYGFELSWHASFTDYLDDISTTYTTTTSDVANRYDELPSGADVPRSIYYEPGQKRGDPSNQDNFLLANFTYSYVLLGSSANTLYRQHTKDAKYKRNVKRRIRAKF